MASLEIEQFICLSDNYAVLLHDPESGETASVDAPDGDAIVARLEEKGWTLSHVFVTHKHADHVRGLAALAKRFAPRVIAPAASARQIGHVHETVEDGDTFEWAGRPVRVFATPGHTLDHLSYDLPNDGLAFVADALFALGCGRIFEGTPEMMWDTMLAIRSLPEDTVLYCGHEYTLSNARFAVTVDPDNAALKDRAREVAAIRERGEMTLPTTVALERETNPFLRADEAGVQAAVGMAGADPAKVFGEVRRRKDAA